MKKFLTSLTAAIVGVGAILWLVLAVSLASIIGRALALVVLWRWFAVPQFELAPLTLPMAGGLMTMVTLAAPPVLPRPSSVEEKEGKTSASWRTTLAAIGAQLIHPLIAVAIGWVFVRLL